MAAVRPVLRGPDLDTLRTMARPYVRYWPVLMGIFAGLVLLWLRGELFVIDGRPAGYQWPAWVYSAWNWHHGHLEMMDPFRDPLHSVLVGLLGESVGYADAALLWAGFSMVVVLVAATGTATLLGDRWAGALTAVTIPLSPVVASGARWATGYPLAAASVGATVAAAAWFVRRPGPLPLILCSGSVILGLLTDDRAILALPPAAVMVVWGAWRLRVRWRLLAPLVLAGAVAVGHTAAPWLGQFNGLEWSQKQRIQRRVVHRWATTDSLGGDMRAACWGTPEELYLTYDFLGTRCAVEILRLNAQQRLPAATAWPAGALAVAVLLWGVRRRDFVVPTVVASIGATVALSAVMTPLPARYLLIFTGLLAPVVPVAAATVLRRAPEWVRAVACVGIAIAVFRADPHADSRKLYDRNDTRWSGPGQWATILREQMQPEDELLDCADTFAAVALLPRQVAAGHPQLSMPDDIPCYTWLSGAPEAGMRFVLVSLSPENGRADLDAMVRQNGNWTVVARRDRVVLWRRSPE